jgi:hypothetical protein
MCAERGACVRRRSWAGYTINIFEFEFPTGQVASRSEGTSVGAAMTAGTLHVEDPLADPAKVYLAPDAVADGDEGAARADVFSHGAIAYPILTERPPVTNPFDLPSRLREGNRLLLSGTMNGAGRRLEELAPDRSTAPPA